jgi:hypothetical protein
VPNRRPTIWLVAASALLIVEAVVLLATSPGDLTAVSLVVSVLLSALVLRGSRLVWVIIVLAAGSQIVSSVTLKEQYLSLATGAIMAGCLLAPSSVRFVWRQGSPSGGPWLVVWSLSRKIAAAGRYGLSHLAGWDSDEANRVSAGKRRSYSLLVWRLGVGSVLLLLLVGGTYEWQQNSGGDSPFINAIARITWTCWAVVQVAFIVSVVIALHHRLVSPSNMSHSSASDS